MFSCHEEQPNQFVQFRQIVLEGFRDSLNGFIDSKTKHSAERWKAGGPKQAKNIAEAITAVAQWILHVRKFQRKSIKKVRPSYSARESIAIKAENGKLLLIFTPSVIRTKKIIKSLLLFRRANLESSVFIAHSLAIDFNFPISFSKLLVLCEDQEWWDNELTVLCFYVEGLQWWTEHSILNLQNLLVKVRKNHWLALRFTSPWIN